MDAYHALELTLSTVTGVVTLLCLLAAAAGFAVDAYVQRVRARGLRAGPGSRLYREAPKVDLKIEMIMLAVIVVFAAVRILSLLLRAVAAALTLDVFESGVGKAHLVTMLVSNGLLFTVVFNLHVSYMPVVIGKIIPNLTQRSMPFFERHGRLIAVGVGVAVNVLVHALMLATAVATAAVPNVREASFITPLQLAFFLSNALVHVAASALGVALNVLLVAVILRSRQARWQRRVLSSVRVTLAVTATVLLYGIKYITLFTSGSIPNEIAGTVVRYLGYYADILLVCILLGTHSLGAAYLLGRRGISVGALLDWLEARRQRGKEVDIDTLSDELDGTG